MLGPDRLDPRRHQVGSDESSRRQHLYLRDRETTHLGRDGRSEVRLVADDNVRLPVATMLENPRRVSAGALVGEVLGELHFGRAGIGRSQGRAVTSWRRLVGGPRRARREGLETECFDVRGEPARPCDRDLVPHPQRGASDGDQRVEVPETADVAEEDAHRGVTLAALIGSNCGASSASTRPPSFFDR